MLYNPFSLEGKTVLVTGASSGIGQATAIECSKMGAKVVVTGRNEARLHETMQNLTGEGHQAIVADLADFEDVNRLVDEMPCVDGIVNNAGFALLQLVPFIKQEDMEQIVKVNLEAPILLTQRAVKKKKINKGGSIVFTSSIASKGAASPGNSLYSATKGGMSAFMRNAAVELAAKKIRCNAVLPGMVETPMKGNYVLITKEQWEINKSKYPLKRFGHPEDVAYAIIYLLSEASSWVTGTELVIDGGRCLQ